MASISARTALNSSFLHSLSIVPAGIFVGGTSGIGQGMAEAFATHTQGNAHIVIVGRNQTAAEEIIAKFPQPTSAEAKHEFVQCDVTLMANVAKTTSELLSRIPRVNYLVMSPSYTTMKNRDESVEGLDRKLAVHYYARWKFVNDLMPALKKAKADGQDAKVYSVLSAGYGGAIKVDDLGMKKSFSKTNMAMVAPTYNDLMFEEFYARNPEITFAHAYPGGVDTGFFSKSESSFIRTAFKIATPIMPLLRPFIFTYQQAGENMLHGMLTTAKEPGLWRLNQCGEDIGRSRWFGTAEERKALWDHTVEEMERVKH